MPAALRPRHSMGFWRPIASALALTACGTAWTTSATGLSIEPVERLTITAPATVAVDRDQVAIPVTLESTGTVSATDTTLRVWGPGYGTLRARTLDIGPIRPGRGRRVVIRLRGRAATFRQPVYLSASSSSVSGATRTILIEPTPDASMDGQGLAFSGLAGMSRGSRVIW